MAESTKFPHLSGNWGRGTPSGVSDINLLEAIQFCSQEALHMHNRQITYEVTLISSDHYKNSSVIVDLAIGQIPRSTNVFLVIIVKATPTIVGEAFIFTSELFFTTHRHSR